MDNRTEAKNEARLKQASEDANFMAHGQSAGGIAAAENKCSTASIPGCDPRANMLRQIDYVEDRLISELGMLRDARRTINFAGHEAIQALEQFIRLDQVFRRY